MSRNAQLIIMLEDELPNCHNQERVDEFAVRCCGSSISNSTQREGYGLVFKRSFAFLRPAAYLVPSMIRLGWYLLVFSPERHDQQEDAQTSIR